MKSMNQMIKKINLLTLVMAILMISGCGEDVDPIQGEAKIVMKAKTELGTINPGARVLDNHLEFTSAMLGVGKVELKTNSSLLNDDSNDDNSDDDSDDIDDDVEKFSTSRRTRAV